MPSLLNDYSFDKLKQRIKEIKKKNAILCKRFKIYKLSANVQDIEKHACIKSNILDDVEIAAVENCYKKALKLAEHSIKLKIIKKQQKMKSHEKSYRDSIVSCESNLGIRRKKHKSISFTPEVNSYLNDSSTSANKKIKINKVETSNENANTISLSTSNSPHCYINKNRKLQKFHSSYPVLDSVFLKSSDGVYRPQISCKNSVSDLRNMPLAKSCNKPQYETVVNNAAETRNVNNTLNNLTEQFKFIEQKGDVKKKSVQAVIPEMNSAENPVSLEHDLTNPVEVITLEDVTDPVEVITLEHDLIDPVEMITPVLELTEKSSAAITPELYFAETHGEVIVPELDFTEEPVDFQVPMIHVDESPNISSKKINSFKSKGIKIRKGIWSKKEEGLLRRNFRDFQTQFGIYDTRLLLGIGRNLLFTKNECIHIKKFLKAKHFYIRLGKDINNRTLHSVYVKARLMFNTFKSSECITPNDVAAVVELQKKYGNRWSLISQKLGIYPQQCFRIHLNHKKSYNKGKWSKSEVENLISAIKSVANKSELNHCKINFWNRIAEFVSTRNARQCFDEWRLNQSKHSKNVSYKKWDRFDTAKLVVLLKNKYADSDEDDISWSELQKSFKHVKHSEFALKSTWYKIKQSIPERFKRNLSEIIDFCYKKHNKYIVPSI